MRAFQPTSLSLSGSQTSSSSKSNKTKNWKILPGVRTKKHQNQSNMSNIVSSGDKRPSAQPTPSSESAPPRPPPPSLTRQSSAGAGGGKVAASSSGGAADPSSQIHSR